MKTMPQMPAMKKNETTEVASPSVHSSPVPASSEAGSEDLNVPGHELTKPHLDKAEEKDNSLVKVAFNTPRNGIEVMATRKGFYNQHRIQENETFKIGSFEELGDWMKCVDPDLEKKRLEILKSRKAK